jgi:lipopolysaccharide export system protein LptA
MRGTTRWLLLLAILAILAGIGVTYQAQKKVLRAEARAKPPMLPSQISGLRDDFHWTRTDAGQAKSEISARKVRQAKDSNEVHLDQVELKIYNKDGDHYDLVKSAEAELNESESHMYSEGAVDVTLSVPVEGQPTRQLVNIKSSGVNFNVKTGKAETDRAADFTFENGTGKSVGVSYDPTTRELYLRQHAEIDWKAPTPNAKLMKIEAGELVYKEAESVIWLNHWARMTRENTVVNAASSVVKLEDGAIHQINAVKAQGTDEYPKRKLEYAADEVQVTYNDQGEVDRIHGRSNARLFSVSEGSETTMTSDVVDLDFETLNNDSVLKKAAGKGHATILTKPLTAPDGKLPETKVIHSEIVEVQMRPGGREIETVRTLTPGRLDLLPNQPAQHQRRLDAQSMVMNYGSNNQLQSFHAVNVETQTEPNAEERAKKQNGSKTHSKNLSAEFDPKTGQMKHMEQWDDFLYQAGDRRATANRATLDQDRNLMTLDQAARIWDATGATSADRILVDQKSGDFAAEGHVSSSRLPDQKTSPSGMLAGDEMVEAMADRMTSANHNHLLHYEGHVVMWQGADRIAAARTDVDRDKRMVSAAGNVITEFREKKDEDKNGTANAAATPSPDSQAPTPIFVIVRAASLIYTDQDRLAHYSGGVVLNRPGLQVKADELRAILAEQNPPEKKDEKKDAKDAKKEPGDDEPSRLEKAYADGHAEIVQDAPDRTRTGTADHAEYYTDNERIVLRGGKPQMLDSKKGYTRGAELTYFVNDDRLMVSGSPKQRAMSHLLRK